MYSFGILFIIQSKLRLNKLYIELKFYLTPLTMILNLIRFKEGQVFHG